jgi:hypothetical protein
MPRPKRINSSPTPGHPLGKVEKSRCRMYPQSIVCGQRQRTTPAFGNFRIPLSGDVRLSKVDDAAPESDRDRVRAVVRTEFGEDALDVALHGIFRQR